MTKITAHNRKYFFVSLTFKLNCCALTFQMRGQFQNKHISITESCPTKQKCYNTKEFILIPKKMQKNNLWKMYSKSLIRSNGLKIYLIDAV